MIRLFGVLPVVLFIMLIPGRLSAQDSYEGLFEEFVHPDDCLRKRVIRDTQLRQEQWHQLAQPVFWQLVMNLDPDSSVLNLADTREILDIFPTESYDTLSTEEKKDFKDSVLNAYRLPENTRIYVTYGKRDYYDIESMFDEIDRGIHAFLEAGTDPWYAQAILLIESPGRIRQSYTGAVGHFQLMKHVAISQGLVVNRSRDDRKDFEKSARAAAKFIQRVCIPHTKEMLRNKGIAFEEHDLWFRLLVMHVYHAGAANVRGALNQIPTRTGGIQLIQKLWKTEYRGFRNASQNYSQLALASFLELERIMDTGSPAPCVETQEAGLH
ncbi:transglycosylase SLT domain-containing protein [Pontibacter sp. G13]|uniref:transglycosylase SLT domain-containing protein n=1 Tax=Pontibacter sp. G13 TaxID=3074898 RepID=UPI00288BF9A4|nr:transglycosylase SLT domain-containing protein [Pontibacter sp. G13]WNJ18755.1 transglycosylase SLT domain-containing protein [Pontibacter sp. G13]